MARPARRQPPTRPTRAVLYLRVSTDEQGDSGLGLEAQEAACRRWAEYKGVEVVAVEVDVCSGAKLPASRPAFRRVLARLESGAADTLVCAKLDRLTRSSLGLADVLDLTESIGFALVLLDYDFDSSSPVGRMVLKMLADVAEYERELIAERTRNALAAKRAKGERTGPGPLLDPAVRREIAARVEAGQSKKSLAAELNARGVPTATGRGRWYPSTILAVCRSVAYDDELERARRRGGAA
jgi:DNA invertase Pin-like site-specific DNA recombinase